MTDQEQNPEKGQKIDPSFLGFYDKLYWKTCEQADGEFKKFDHSINFLSAAGIGWLVEFLIKGQPQFGPKFAIIFFLISILSSVTGILANGIGLSLRKEDIMTAINKLHTSPLQDFPLGSKIGYWSNWVSIISFTAALITIALIVFYGIQVKPS